MKCLLVLAFGALIVLGCEREILVESSLVISGYRIDGRVVDRIGNPVANVEIILFYSYEYVDYNTPPSKAYFVPPSQPQVTVVVRNRAGVTLRTLYSGNPPQGSFLVDWDKKDALGNMVSPSTYSVHYLVNGFSQKSYDVTVDGTVVARSDSLGSFSIPGNNLPIGFYPVPIYDATETTFYGNHRISSNATLLFVAPTSRREITVFVLENRVTLLEVVIG